MVLPMSRSTRPLTRLLPEITLSSRRRVAPAAASSEAAEVPSVPAHFRCPISLDLMRDPVTAPTGITYDRESVEGWLARGNATCPVTGRGPLRAADLVPNHATRRMIQAWCVANKAERVPTPRAPLADADAAEAVGAIVSAAAANNAAACGAAAARARALARESERDRRCLAAAGAARALAAAFARLSSSSSGGNGVVSAAALGEVLAALTVFFPLDGEARRCIVASSTALESLVLVMSRGELTGRTSAAIVLRELTSSADPGSAVVEAVSETPGLCDALVSLVRHPVSPQATKAALVTAYYLVSSSSNRISTAAAHRLAPLVPVVLELLVDADKGTSEKALAALDGVLRAADAGRAAAAAHALAVPVLVKKMFRVSDMATEFAVSALWRLCRDDDGEACRAEALRVGAFQKLLLLLQVGCGGVTKERASDLLKMLNGSRGSVECIETVDFKGLKRPF